MAVTVDCRPTKNMPITIAWIYTAPNSTLYQPKGSLMDEVRDYEDSACPLMNIALETAVPSGHHKTFG